MPRLASPSTPPARVVVALPSTRSDADVLDGLRAGEAWARAVLFDRYAPLVERVLRRALGSDPRGELGDLIHDCFVQALASAASVREATALPAWMQSVAIHTAYKTIRARRARRWLRFWEPDDLPEIEAPGAEPEVLEATRRTYAILDKLPAVERVAFALRVIDGMALADLAAASGVSLATIKRRVAKAEERFTALAAKDPVLAKWLEEGARWTT